MPLCDALGGPAWGAAWRKATDAPRAGTLASDWYYLGRVRSAEEIQTAVNALSPERIVEHLRGCPPRDFTIVTLGPKPLEVQE